MLRSAAQGAGRHIFSANALGKVIDEIARCGFLGVVWGINGGATVGTTPLASRRAEEQKTEWLAPLLRG